MFVDEIKIYARAGHGGKGCVAFQREKYRPKGGPSGGTGGRGGSVILEADHDLNNLIAQYYQPRLLAKDGQFGMGNGMDGHAGKDLLVKVPCGTIVWQLDATDSPADVGTSEPEDGPPAFKTTAGQRPLICAASGARAFEVDLAAEGAEERCVAGPKGDLIADLTQHGQRYVLCKGGRGGLGNRNFATATRQTPRFAQPGEPGGEGNFRF